MKAINQADQIIQRSLFLFINLCMYLQTGHYELFNIKSFNTQRRCKITTQSSFITDHSGTFNS